MKHKFNSLKLIALLILISQFTFAQEEQKQSKLAIGVHGGVGFAKWHSNTSNFKYSFIPTAMSGVTGNYRINNFLILNGELNFELKGTRFDYSQQSTIGTVDDPTFSGTASKLLGYVIIPLTAKFTTYGHKVNGFLNVGMYNEVIVKYVDFGLVTGFGMDVAIKKHLQFTMEIRNNHGLTAINDDKEKPKNETLVLLFGLAYKI